MSSIYDNLIEELTKYDKLYENVRIVNPKTKKVLFYKEDTWVNEPLPCHAIWDVKTPCKNCTSIRAIQSNETVVKIQYTNNKVYMVTSIPSKIKGVEVVIELLKDATNSMDIIDDRINELRKIIDKTNEMTITDSLTNIFNRKYINERMPFEINQLSTQKDSTFLVMGDIDDFKIVNDTFGHVAGDEVLKKIAKILSKNIRSNDWVARYGGEEFLMCLTEITLKEATKITENIRQIIENHNFTLNKKIVHVTCSFGLSEIASKDTTESIIKRADLNLYKAKDAGKNKVVYS
ncbi:MAG: GGDEF domain-containing protein [Candidatus Izemoplasmatales bacterium]|nr:GGDEF domain-containing protein [Candidatus Izemoplasmatales bacterium]